MISDDKVQVKNGLLSEERPVELVTSPTQGSLPLLSNGVADRGEIKRGVSIGVSAGHPSLHLDGIQPSHLHLQQPVLPVEAGYPEVVDAP